MENHFSQFKKENPDAYSVYTSICNHKKMTTEGIESITRFSAEEVNELIDVLIRKGFVIEKKAKTGDKFYTAKEMYYQGRLFD